MRVIAGLGVSIPSTWNVTSLSEVTSKIGSGATPRGGAAVYVNDGPAFIRSQNVHDNRFKDEGLVFLSDQAARALKGVTVQEDDVLINITGDSILRTCLVPKRVLPARVNQHVAIVRSNRLVHPAFLQKWLSQPLMKDFMLGHSSGGTRKAITKGHLQSFPIPLPPIEEQRGIAATLSAFDSKIESNQRVIDIVPQLIAAYVGEALASSNASIPIAKLAKFVNGGAYTKGASGTGRMVLRIAELNSGPGNSTVYNDIDVPDDKTARAGDILMSWSGSLGVYRWFRGEAIINQHIFKVLPTGYPSWLVFDRLEAVMPVFRGIAQDKATTMGHIQRGHLESSTIEVPSPEDAKRLDSTLGPLWQRLLLAERENVRLEVLRDALLPELLTGRIRVPEAVGGRVT